MAYQTQDALSLLQFMEHYVWHRGYPTFQRFCKLNSLLALHPLTTSKVVWDRLKQLYEKSNKGSQVNLHQQLCHLQMSDSDDIVEFLETWQSLMQEAAIAGCTFTDFQQANLLLGTLPDSWSAFITTQGGLTDLTFPNLLSNILQQHAINFSKNS